MSGGIQIVANINANVDADAADSEVPLRGNSYDIGAAEATGKAPTQQALFPLRCRRNGCAVVALTERAPAPSPGLCFRYQYCLG